MSKKYPPGVLSRSTPKLAHSAVSAQSPGLFSVQFLVFSVHRTQDQDNNTPPAGAET